MRTTKYLEELKYGLILAVVVAALPEMAWAQAADLAGIVNNTTTGIGEIPTLISGISYLGGLGLGVMGVIDLKKHADAPANNPMSKGIGKLAAGGGLVALPGLANVMNVTTGGAGDVAFTGAGNIIP